MPAEKTNISRVEQLQVLQLLYPWYKEEVFRRREQMVRLTAFGCTFLTLLLITILVFYPPSIINATAKLFSITGIGLFSGLFVYLILQHWNRHRNAKRILIDIEKRLGFYEEGMYLAAKSLYPDNWQMAWQSDRSIIVYIVLITTLTVLFIAAIFAK